MLESPRKPGTHLRTVKTAYQGILERSGMRPWSPHDLRRTAASKMRPMGVSAVYDRYGADPEKQRALTKWGRRVEVIAGGEPGARVVEFRARGRAGGYLGADLWSERDAQNYVDQLRREWNGRP